MSYILKEEVAKDILKKYKNSYIADTLGLTVPYISVILHRKRPIQKHVAYSLTKIINNNAEIDDFFERV